MLSRRVVKRLIPLAVIVLLLAAVGFVWVNLGRWLSGTDHERRVDLLVVGGTDVEEINRRLPIAVDHVESGRAKELLIIAAPPGDVLRQHSAIDRFIEDQAPDAEHEIFTRGRNAFADARGIAKRLASTEERERVAVLAHPLEIARTRLIYERLVDGDALVWTDRAPYNEDRWWRTDRTRTLSAAASYLSTVALLGPGAEAASGEVPPSLTLRAFLGGIIVAALAGAFCRPLARRLGLVAIPRLWRAHTTPTPMLGGLAIILGLGGGILAAGDVSVGALGVAAGAGVLVVALVGLVDDIAGLGPWARLIWALAAGSAAWLLGLRAELVVGGAQVADAINVAVTLLWFVGITHAMNVLDHIDGATAGVGAASAAAIAVTAALGGQIVVAVAAAALAGACIGYLPHNVHPARLFMGDMGALGLGFALASVSLALTPQARPPLSMAAAVIALGVPIFDTILVTLARLGAGQSPAVGGTDHTSHRLIARGWSVRAAAAFLAGAQVVLGIAAVGVARLPAPAGWTIVTIVAAAGMACLVLFLRMKPWMPPWHLRASAQFVHLVEEAMQSLRALEDVVGDEAWRLSDPKTARSTQEALRRLERVRGFVERGAQREAREADQVERGTREAAEVQRDRPHAADQPERSI